MITSVENDQFKFEQVEDGDTTYHTHVSKDGIEVTNRNQGISIFLKPKVDTKKVTFKALVQAVTAALNQHVINPDDYAHLRDGFIHHFTRLFRDSQLAFS